MARARPVEGLKPEETVRANAQKIVAVRTAEFFSFAPYLANPAYVTQLHDMRIAAKRLRYALELFRDALDPDVADGIALIKEFQEFVGDIHDHDVLVGILRAHLETLSAERARALAALAVDAEEEIEAFKWRGRAFVTDDAWVAEQAAIAAAIARTTRERRERYDELVVQWAAWRAAGLRERLEALTVDLPDDLAGRNVRKPPATKPHAAPLTEPDAEGAEEDEPVIAGGDNNARRGRARGFITAALRRTRRGL